MTSRKKRWLVAIVAVFLIFVCSVFIARRILMRRLEPMIREQAVRYLRERFRSDIQLAALHVHLPRVSTVGLLFRRQRGAVAGVDGEGLRVRRPGTDADMLTVDKLSFKIDIAAVMDTHKTVDYVLLQGVRIVIPPKQERNASQDANAGAKGDPLDITVQRVDIRDATLVIEPKDKTRNALLYRIDRLDLTSVGRDSPMNYDADLSIPKPPGRVRSQGKFGPWNAGEPGDTALAGNYKFDHADLGVFNGIAGILTSTGEFQGTLDEIYAKGEAYVPDFRLKKPGTPVPLRAQFEVQVEGTNGDTILKPVHATLGSTTFSTTGAVVKHEDDPRRTISLAVSMPNGHLPDLLRLTMKGPAFMDGRVALKTRIDIPPLSSKVKQKLLLDGTFGVRDARFLRSTIQSQIDKLSRRGQGQPKNEEIDSVASDMKGDFHLENQILNFRSLVFSVPGADIALAGNYDMEKDQLDFHGDMRLDAKVSQTVTGWKSWVLKPVDPFFAKHGAGTFLHILVEGDARKPHFGAEFHRRDSSGNAAQR